jgi:hypothetical protein
MTEFLVVPRKGVYLRQPWRVLSVAALRIARVLFDRHAWLAQSFRGHRVARMLMSFDRAIALLRTTRHEDPRAGSDSFNQSQKDPPFTG